MRISSLLSDIEDIGTEGSMLRHILDEDTDIIGDEIYFHHQGDTRTSHDDMSGIYAQKDEQDDDEKEDIDTMSPHVVYEIFSRRFFQVEEAKRQAFALGKYDDIDMYNEQLLSLQIQLEKLQKIFGEGVEDEGMRT